MKHRMFSIKDTKADVYNKPFYLINEKLVERVAADLLRDKSSEISRHPDDFIMFDLGSYDDNTGTFTLNELPTVLFRFSDLEHLRTGETFSAGDMIKDIPEFLQAKSNGVSRDAK